MIINPQKYIDNNWITSRFPGDYPLSPTQVQQAGFDVRVLTIQLIGSEGPGVLGRNSKTIPNYSEVPMIKNDTFFLSKGNAYAVDCMEDVSIPIGYEGKLIHRSTCNRSGVLLTGSVYDPGYKGLIGGTLYVFNDFQVEIGARIGQFQIQTAEVGAGYAGDYQNLTTHQQGANKVQEKYHGTSPKKADNI